VTLKEEAAMAGAKNWLNLALDIDALIVWA